MSVKRILGALSVFAFGLSPLMSNAQPVTETMYRQSLADAENWREVDPENLFVYDIADAAGRSKGRILVEASEFAAPTHVAQVRKIIRSGLYDGTDFHRVISDFMVQGGDVDAKMAKEDQRSNMNADEKAEHAKQKEALAELTQINGEFEFARNPETQVLEAVVDPKFSTTGYMSGFPVNSETGLLLGILKDTENTVKSWIPHCQGVTSMARTADPNSAKAQFFLMREHSPHLDRQYSAWGRVVDGLDAVLGVKASPNPDRDGGSVQNPDVLVRVQVASDMPADERPEVLIEQTSGPAFEAKLATYTGTGSTACDLPKPRTLVKRQD